ncbi:DUF4251 domain-containing protein [Carboxylicivirga linearis]|uniref:DUF4251 domain-containing protein n=1 Tax=Carboxylicivirga linearis TaxID=1628157 RepID=A0ABS5JYL0_9BACT|nr:DUF4251 domain-containing protein [Carboxylicivirga linearis]MBS2099993.1 DUF4251 domain-containing protein [Carboxylicivirga linearis]
MKSYFIILIALALTSGLYAQKNEKELTRKEKRELKKKEDAKLSEAMAKVLSLAIDSQLWVLEANTLSNKYGRSVPVNSNLNFIAIEKDEAFIQLGSNSGLGPNGVGGVSVRAKINKYEVKRNEKKGNYYIHIYTSSAIGSWDIRIDSNKDGTIASATVQGNTSTRVNYQGTIVPVGQSRVYKGTPVI